MDREILTFDKMSDWKRTMKVFVRGAIKSKLFTSDKKIEFVVEKDVDNYVTMGIKEGPFYAEFPAKVSTRVYNLITEQMFEPVVAQFSKLKNFNGLKFTVVDAK